MILISALVVVFAGISSYFFVHLNHYFDFLVQTQAKPWENIPDFKLEDLDDVIKDAAPRLAATADLFRSQVDSLEKAIKKNADKLPLLSTINFEAFRERMNERKKKLNNFIDTFKPKMQKYADLTVELFKNGKTSDKYFNEGLAKAAPSVKASADALSQALDAIKGAAKISN